MMDDGILWILTGVLAMGIAMCGMELGRIARALEGFTTPYTGEMTDAEKAQIQANLERRGGK